MKKFQLAVASIGALLLPVLALAQIPGPQVNSLDQVIHDIENAAGAVFGAIAVISFIVAGILFLTAQGNPEKVQQARSAVIWGIAGVIVGILSFSIIAIVGSIIR